MKIQLNRIINIFGNLKEALHNLYSIVNNTAKIEKGLEGFLCPMQMFFELSGNGFNYNAFKMLKHDLNVKRIYLTNIVFSYLRDVAGAVKVVNAIKVISAVKVPGVVEESIGTPSSFNLSKDSITAVNKSPAGIFRTRAESHNKLTPIGNVISVPVFIIGVIYAIITNIRKYIANFLKHRL
ncbi:MAG: hypothetical protein HQK89_05630 [Nitrospirae bacterium]|nr:hypothetical protein [Nitrospirota bacterium]